MLSGEQVVISEFMAANSTTLADLEGDYSDWIELHNQAAEPMDLAGWSLTDSADAPDKWRLPELTLGSGDFLVVFASGKDFRDPSAELHTNFRLSAGGEYLALVAPDGSVESRFDPSYPAQRTDVSYGIGADDQPHYFASATPGSANDREYLAFTSEVTFSAPSGFYEEPFRLTLATELPEAVIRWTTNGSDPTWENGLEYTEPIEIGGSTVIRAAAFFDGFQTDTFGTRTYLFLDSVIAQNNADVIASGLPRTWGGKSADYGMDPHVIGQEGQDRFDGKYAATIKDDLLSIPSISLVVDQEAMFGRTGIYSRPEDRTKEATVSAELINPDGSDGFQIGAALKIQGGISRRVTSKFSLRMVFRDELGASTLNFPLFGDGAASQFNSISLRSSGGEVLVGTHYIRDPFARRTQLAVGSPSPHSRFVHLYINGLYWGVYEATERPDETFAANYFGGDPSDWDVINAGDLGSERDTAIAGNLDAWQSLIRLTQDLRRAEDKQPLYYQIQGQNPDGTKNPDFEVWLDVDNYIDYLIVNFFIANRDWPHRNFYMMRDRGPGSTGFKFVVWDAEFTLDSGTRTSIPGFGSGQSLGPSQIFPGLFTVPDFKIRFADRIQKHLGPGGALYTNPDQTAWDPVHPAWNPSAARYAQLVAEYSSPLVAESARWGDVIDNRNGQQSTTILTRDESWMKKVDNNYRVFFARATSNLIKDVERAKIYLAPPTITPAGGLLDSHLPITLVSAKETDEIFYTTDGSDPRLPGGGISPAAQLYSQSLSFSSRVTITARRLVSGQWSAIVAATFAEGLPASAANLTISELNYNPRAADTSRGEIEAGNDEFEFIEVTNISPWPVSLAGVRFAETGVDAEGIRFHFADQIVAPGASLLVVENVAAFRSRYGVAVQLAEGSADDPEQNSQQYGGKLSNGGERVTLLAADDSVIRQFVYDDAWRPTTDGGGPTLELADFVATTSDQLSQLASWRASSAADGSPGDGWLRGDFNNDRQLEASDIDRVLGNLGSALVGLDLNQDQIVDDADVTVLVEGIIGSRRGDANLDGRVDFGDFEIMMDNFRRPARGWAGGDFSGNGEVDFEDFVLLAQAFGFARETAL